METMEYSLQEPIKSHAKVDGKFELIDLHTLYFKAPSKQERDITRALKKQFLTSIITLPELSRESDLARHEVEKEDGKFDAKTIKFILFAVKDLDINKFFAGFKNLFSRVAFKDAALEIKMQTLDLDNLEEDDLENIIAKYMEFFFVTSWMKSLNQD